MNSLPMNLETGREEGSRVKVPTNVNDLVTNGKLLVHGHVYSRGIFLKKANHYDYFDCYTLGNAKPVVGTSENVAEPDYDVINMAAILKFNTNLRCFIISIIVGRFQFFRQQNVQNDKCCLLTPKQNG